MNTIKLNDKSPVPAPNVATIGFFDGVHRGHKYLIERVVAEARAAGMESMVITFDRHPRQVLQSDYIPEMLSTPDMKLLLLSKTEIDNAAMLHFDKQMTQLSAYEFMAQVLRDRLNVRKLIIGYDNRFGHNRAEGFDDYVRYGRELGIEVVLNQAFVLDGVNVSSSVVRKHLCQGEVEKAEECLGYPYTIMGKVVTGYKEGRKLGFPTANLDTDGYGQLIPAPGVYAVKVRLEGSVAHRNGMMNIGVRPTFGGNKISLETHIFDFDEDVYGKTMFVSFTSRIREEKKFENVQQLIEQLNVDRNIIENKIKEENEL